MSQTYVTTTPRRHRFRLPIEVDPLSQYTPFHGEQGFSVLDFGAGTGAHSWSYILCGAHVSSFNLEPEHLDEWRENLESCLGPGMVVCHDLSGMTALEKVEHLRLELEAQRDIALLRIGKEAAALWLRNAAALVERCQISRISVQCASLNQVKSMVSAFVGDRFWISECELDPRTGSYELRGLDKDELEGERVSAIHCDLDISSGVYGSGEVVLDARGSFPLNPGIPDPEFRWMVNGKAMGRKEGILRLPVNLLVGLNTVAVSAMAGVHSGSMEQAFWIPDPGKKPWKDAVTLEANFVEAIRVGRGRSRFRIPSAVFPRHSGTLDLRLKINSSDPGLENETAWLEHSGRSLLLKRGMMEVVFPGIPADSDFEFALHWPRPREIGIEWWPVYGVATKLLGKDVSDFGRDETYREIDSNPRSYGVFSKERFRLPGTAFPNGSKPTVISIEIASHPDMGLELDGVFIENEHTHELQPWHNVFEIPAHGGCDDLHFEIILAEPNQVRIAWWWR